MRKNVHVVPRHADGVQPCTVLLFLPHTFHSRASSRLSSRVSRAHPHLEARSFVSCSMFHVLLSITQWLSCLGACLKCYISGAWHQLTFGGEGVLETRALCELGRHRGLGCRRDRGDSVLWGVWERHGQPNTIHTSAGLAERRIEGRYFIVAHMLH